MLFSMPHRRVEPGEHGADRLAVARAVAGFAAAAAGGHCRAGDCLAADRRPCSAPCAWRLAALARSTKEGQYYLMPLLLVTMPLVMLPMSPGVELNLGNSLIPVTGVVLLLRSMLDGEYWQALQFAPIVVAVTLVTCLISIRWAVDQFHSESVLFRESERLDLRLWLRYLLRDRQPTPTAPAALACGVLILVVHFVLSFWAAMPEDFGSLARAALTTQLVVIATPALMMTLFVTSSPRRTLLLKLPPWRAVPAAVLLAVVLAPLANHLQTVVQRLYPINESLQPTLEKMSELLRQVDFWPFVLVIAVVPAICEELAFRGFILSGFRDLGHRGRAVIYSAPAVRADARNLAAVADRLAAGRGAGLPGRADRQHFAVHGIPCLSQHAGGGGDPDHTRGARSVVVARGHDAAGQGWQHLPLADRDGRRTRRLAGGGVAFSAFAPLLGGRRCPK